MQNPGGGKGQERGNNRIDPMSVQLTHEQKAYPCMRAKTDPNT